MFSPSRRQLFRLRQFRSSYYLFPSGLYYTLGILNLALDKKSDPFFTSILGLVAYDLRRIPKTKRQISARSLRVPNTLFEAFQLLSGIVKMGLKTIRLRALQLAG